MSYDIYIVADLGGPEPVSIDDFYWNHTSNVAPMWRKAMPETDGLAGLHGMACGDAALAVGVGIARMKADPDPYREMNPENKWGDFVSQLDALERLYEGCRRVPQARIEVSR